MSMKELLSHDPSIRDPLGISEYKPSVGAPRRIPFSSNLMEDPQLRKEEVKEHQSRRQQTYARRRPNEPQAASPPAQVFFDGAASPVHKRVGYGIDHMFEIPSEAAARERAMLSKHGAVRETNLHLVQDRTQASQQHRHEEISADRELWTVRDPWGKPSVGVPKRTNSGKLIAGRVDAVAMGKHYTDGPNDSYFAQHFGTSSPPKDVPSHGRRAEVTRGAHHSTGGPDDSYMATHFGRGKQSPPPRAAPQPHYSTMAEALGARYS
eukprot:m.239787 g.239787  ORF g.239787 m.239787 type:complete len:265 (-) comp22818_c0_seq1:28-822(-)